MNADFPEGGPGVPTSPVPDAANPELEGPGETTGEPEEGMHYSEALGMTEEEWMAKDMAPASLED